MNCGMSALAEHLNVFDGRKVICLLDSVCGLIHWSFIIFKALGKYWHVL